MDIEVPDPLGAATETEDLIDRFVADAKARYEAIPSILNYRARNRWAIDALSALPLTYRPTEYVSLGPILSAERDVVKAMLGLTSPFVVGQVKEHHFRSRE